MQVFLTLYAAFEHEKHKKIKSDGNISFKLVKLKKTHSNKTFCLMFKDLL